MLATQQIIDYKLLDGQNKLEVQVSLMDTLINQGASVIFLQPIDSVGAGAVASPRPSAPASRSSRSTSTRPSRTRPMSR